MAWIIRSKFLLCRPPRFYWDLKNCCSNNNQSSPIRCDEEESKEEKKNKGPTQLERLKDLKEEEDIERRHKLSQSTIPFDGDNEVNLLLAIPQEQVERRLVRIFQPAKNPMQSGTGNIGHWETAFDNLERWENPNMGWCSSGDPLSNLGLKFSTKEAAVEYCERNGLSWYESKSSIEKKFKLKSYGNNFASKRCRVSTK